MQLFAPSCLATPLPPEECDSDITSIVCSNLLPKPDRGTETGVSENVLRKMAIPLATSVCFQSQRVRYAVTAGKKNNGNIEFV
eukprot:448045-Amphidinium_carterae.1